MIRSLDTKVILGAKTEKGTLWFESCLQIVLFYDYVLL